PASSVAREGLGVARVCVGGEEFVFVGMQDNRSSRGRVGAAAPQCAVAAVGTELRPAGTVDRLGISSGSGDLAATEVDREVVLGECARHPCVASRNRLDRLVMPGGAQRSSGFAGSIGGVGENL